jgi:DNA-binding transcriptional regulator YbjK
MKAAAQAKRRARRSPDPNRREQIARAAIEVVGKRGVERLTHRDVAEAADVPVGSTTYYFKTRDDLLQAALEISAEVTNRRLRQWAANINGSEDLAEALADLVLSYTGPERDIAVVAYELYGAAIRRPQLRGIGMEWVAVMRELLEPLTDEITGEALSLALDGAMMRALIGPAPERSRLEAIFSRALAGAP